MKLPWKGGMPGLKKLETILKKVTNFKQYK